MPTRSTRRRTPKLSPDHVALLSAFNEHKVKYLVVGGYAVGFHSEPRATKDLDIYIRTDEGNSLAVYSALASFGAPLAGITPADFNDGKSFFMIGFPPERIDVLQEIDGVQFDQCWSSRITAIFNGRLEVPVISAEYLIANKLAAGRPRDLLDVADIREAQQEALQKRPTTALVISGWNVRFKKVACTKLLRTLGLDLAEAKNLTDAIIDGQTVTVEIMATQAADFSTKLRQLGVKSVVAFEDS